MNGQPIDIYEMHEVAPMVHALEQLEEGDIAFDEDDLFDAGFDLSQLSCADDSAPFHTYD